MDTSVGLSRSGDGKHSSYERSAYEEYLYGRSIFSEYQLKPNWSSTTRGRVVIRLFSRGIAGALAYAFASRYAANQLRDYEPSAFKWGEVKLTEKPLQYVANAWDVVAGKPIGAFVRLIAPAGHKDIWASDALRFRPKTYFHSLPGGEAGRSLGAEIVSVTFDFSAMSFADAITRNMIQAFDPNLPQPWFVDEKGRATIRSKGHFDLGQWGKAVVRASWRSLSKNAGEDWAAALPYVYQMKWQREALSKIPTLVYDHHLAGRKQQFGGFKVVSDRNRNGGSLIVNERGTIVGDYQLPGVLDLHNRFVGYNVYTLIYREFYDWLGRQITHARTHGVKFDFHMPEKPLQAVVEAIGATGRYLIKSTIKAHLFMQPAVPFFWVFRVPQSKWRSELILDTDNTAQNYIGTWKPQARGEPDPHRKGIYRFPYPLTYDDWVWPQQGLTGAPRPDHIYFGQQKVPFPSSLKRKGVYHLDNCPTLTAKLLNPFGWISYTSGTWLCHAANALVPLESGLSHIIAGTKDLSQIPLQRNVFLRTYADAAWAYTPYFIAKDEFGLRINDTPVTGGLGKMDKAIYSFIDNVFTFRFRNAGKDIGNIWKLSTDDLERPVMHFEGRDGRKQREVEKAAPQSTTDITDPAPEVSAHRIATRPTTKVEATTVQYNTTPPIHLKHSTSSETTHNSTHAQRRAEDTRWADTLSERKAALIQDTNPTVH